VHTPLPRVRFRTQDGGEADLVMRSGDNPEKLRGPNKAGLWIDEASLTHHDVMLLAMATLRYQGRMGPLILTFTPKGRKHWTFDVFYERAEQTPWTKICEDEDGARWLVKRNDDTGVVSKRPIYTFSGLDYVRTANTYLVHADTRSNPFLPREFYDNIRQHYSSQLATQELAGQFVDIEGLMFHRTWFKRVDGVPRDCQRVRYWDRAGTEGGGNYSAGVLVARDAQGIYYIEDVVRGQWSPANRNEVMVQVAEDDARKYANSVQIYVEQEGGSGGKEAAQQALVMLAAYPVYLDVVTGSRIRRKDHQTLPGDAKVVRAQPLAAQAEQGNVRMKSAPWNEEYLEELTAFPEYAFDDQVDATAGAYNKLTKMTSFATGAITRTQVASHDQATDKYGVKLDRKHARRRPRDMQKERRR